MNRRLIKPGELLAIRPDFVQEDRGAFFWLFPPPTKKTERIGNIAVVSINGPLEYHEDPCSDSYDSIVCRVTDAMNGGTDGDDDEDDQACPPACVVLRIDSPGGVVAGLEQTVDKLRALSKSSGIPLYAYADEMAYSAAYALSCACEYVYLPRSGMIGSVGVISTMVDQTKADAKAGLRFVVLTSGKRKADGHPHVPISQAMIAEEAPRVLTLARHFYGMVNRARGIPIKTIRGFEAGRFLGEQATEAGLADEVLSWDRFMSQLGQQYNDNQVSAQLGTKKVRRHGTVVPSSAKDNPMPVSLDVLMKNTRAAMAAEKDPDKLAALGADLSAYKRTKHMIEKHETEEGDEDEEDDEEDEADEAEEAEAPPEKKSKGDETDRSDDEDDDEDDEDDDDAESKSKASAPVASLEAFVASAPKNLRGALAALAEKASAYDQLAPKVAKLENQSRRAKRDALVTGALSAKRITPHQAKLLGKKELSFVESYLAMHTKAIVNTDDDGTEVPSMVGSKEFNAEVEGVTNLIKSLGFKSVTPEKVANNAPKHANGKAPVV